MSELNNPLIWLFSWT